MNFKSNFKKTLEKVFKIKIYRSMPFGCDVFYDIKKFFPNWEPKLILDVGANIGQTTKTYVSKFPKAKIKCFEPSKIAFDQLKNKYGKNKNVECINCALGEKNYKVNFKTLKSSVLSKIFSRKTKIIKGCEFINQFSIDSFYKQKVLKKVFLKIDTEGNDLNVLKGAQSMLKKQFIDFIEIEAGIASDNKTHVPFQKIKKFLESNGYKIFGIYEQVYEWQKSLPYLRRANIVFLSKKLTKKFIFSKNKK